jgi:hypothetical protein
VAEVTQRPISLLEVLQKSTGFDGALLSTFNAYLPFVEEVVIRRLRAAGCRYVVALMDGRQLGAELSVTGRRPHMAGKRYGLLPVECGGVFHPKFALLVGPKAARILIGSHNLTMSGFVHNREITNQIDIAGPKDREGAAAVLEVLSFCAAWSGGLPKALQETLEPLNTFSRPYRGPVSDNMDLRIVGARPSGPSLWEKVRPLLPEGARRVTFVAPFFDEELSFVKRVIADLSPKETVVGLDPTTASFPGTRQLPRGLRVVDAHDLDPGHKGRGYLHGKAILVETKAAEFLITGSANPTAAAWLKASGTRNAEIVIVRKLLLHGGHDLGLRGLWTGRAIASSELKKLRARSEPTAGSAHPPLVGVRAGTTFRVEDKLPSVRGVTVWNAERIGLSCTWMNSGADLVAELGDQIDAACTFEVALDDVTRVGFVHHAALLLGEAVPSSQKDLRRAMGGLSGDPRQLEELLRLVEKVIFDAPAVERALGTKVKSKKETEASKRQPSTAGLVKTIARKKDTERHRLSSGDIGLLMDYLMKKLWRGISHEQATGTRSELDLIDSDDEEVATHDFSDQEIAEAWYKKSRTLLRRLERRIAEADDAAQVVMETTAVLGVLEALRRIEDQDRWKSLRLAFVDRDKAADFAMATLPRLLQPGTGLLDVANEEVGAPFVEEHVLIEWITWLAWLTGFSPADAWDFAYPEDESDGDRNENDDDEVSTEVADRLARACLIGARVLEADSERILELLDSTPFQGIDSREWLHGLIRLGETYANPANATKLGRRPALGDLVVTTAGAGPFIVQRVRGDKADVIDFSREAELVTFTLTSLQILDAGLDQLRLAVG